MTSCTQSRVASVTNGPNFPSGRRRDALLSSGDLSLIHLDGRESCLLVRAQSPRSQGFCDPCKRWGLPLNVERLHKPQWHQLQMPGSVGKKVRRGLLQPRQMCEGMAAQILACSGQREAGEGSVACVSPFQLSVHPSDALCTVLSVPHAKSAVSGSEPMGCGDEFWAPPHCQASRCAFAGVAGLQCLALGINISGGTFLAADAS